MSIFTKIFSKKDKPGTYSYKLNKAKELHGQVIKYVTERIDDDENVVGRGGALTLRDTTFIVDTSGDRLFVCDVKDLDVSWLMSGDGVIIQGPNSLENGKFRSIIVHFVYYRK